MTEFWLQQSSKFIHIDYFAVFGEEAEYPGVLEVSQDVAELREPQGEYHLLDGVQ